MNRCDAYVCHGPGHQSKQIKFSPELECTPSARYLLRGSSKKSVMAISSGYEVGNDDTLVCEPCYEDSVADASPFDLPQHRWSFARIDSGVCENLQRRSCCRRFGYCICTRKRR